MEEGAKENNFKIQEIRTHLPAYIVRRFSRGSWIACKSEGPHLGAALLDLNLE
jgi:hypothetical protein